MCILFIYVNGDASDGSYKLIIASNRDEFYARPALPAAAWKELPHVLGGKNLLPIFTMWNIKFVLCVQKIRSRLRTWP